MKSKKRATVNNPTSAPIESAVNSRKTRDPYMDQPMTKPKNTSF
jgi:hypothetical protein